jgi:rhamnosyltransferase
MGVETVVKKIVAVIVSYNPDTVHLEKMIKEIESQSVDVIVVNNGEKLDYFSEVTPLVIEIGKNVGIAEAQNMAFAKAEQDKYTFVTIFDQDSKIPKNFFKNMYNSLDSSEIGMVVPRIKDLNTNCYIEARTYNRKNKVEIYEPKNLEEENNKNTRKVAIPIASGAMIRISAWSAAGGMTSKLFIDAVDTDFDLRLLISGYDIIQNNEVLLEHPIGNRKPIKFLGKIIFWNTNHSPLRRFTRNSIWLYKSNKKYVKGLLSIVLRTIITHSIYIFFENKDFLKKSLLFNKGLFIGLFSKSPIVIGKQKNE